VAYDDSFTTLLGATPSIKVLLSDPRAPFFYSGGAWLPRSSTLYLTSSLLGDNDPSAAPAASKRTEISKIEFYSPQGLSRDKVRSQERNYLAAGCAPFPSTESPGIVICAQGTLKEPAGLVYVDSKRPHKSHMLLDNFQGRPFNSPCDIVTNFVDNCLYFTDPACGYERGYRPKPELPTGHIYRFDPASGDCRVVANGLSRPGGLAFSPDFTVLYVSELGAKYGGTTIHAFDMIYTTSTSIQPGPLALSISTTSAPRSMTPNSHQKTSSASSTESGDSAHLSFRSSPTASSRGLLAAARSASSNSPTSPTDGHHVGRLRRSNSSERARRVLDIAQSSSRQLRSMSNNLGISLKSSFNTTPSLSQINPQHQQHQCQHRPVQPPNLAPPLTASSSGLSASAMMADRGRLGAFLTNKRLFAFTPSSAPSGGISTDRIQGNVWLGTNQGVEIFSPSLATMVGKILVPDYEDSSPVDRHRDGPKMTGVSRVAFGNEGEAWLLGGERLWRFAFGGGTGSVAGLMR
jgi:sugar lactone lactonase YvrE